MVFHVRRPRKLQSRKLAVLLAFHTLIRAQNCALRWPLWIVARLLGTNLFLSAFKCKQFVHHGEVHLGGNERPDQRRANQKDQLPEPAYLAEHRLQFDVGSLEGLDPSVQANHVRDNVVVVVELLGFPVLVPCNARVVLEVISYYSNISLGLLEDERLVNLL